MSALVFRIVPKGVVAEGFDDDEMDLDQPCDLVALEDLGVDGETELSRKEFGNGHGASAYLLSLIRREKESSKE